MRKLLVIVTLLFFITGCTSNTASGAVKDYLNSYKNLDTGVLDDLETQVESLELNDDQREKYRDILEKQYKDISYDIEKEQKEDDITYVTANIKVYDLYKTQSDASVYLADHMSEFYDETGKYDTSKYMDYKLEKMKDTTNKVEYTITFTVTKNENGDYVVTQPSATDLDKIHGVYEYDVK